LARLASAPQGPAPPLPLPRPITAPPAGYLAKPRPAPPPARAAAPEPSGPRAARAAEPEYGTTPVPWPLGSTDPAHFPKLVPFLPGARRASCSMSAGIASAHGFCDGSPDEVARFYLDFVTRDQWTLIPVPGPPLELDRLVIATKGDWSLRVDASANPFTGGTEVFLSVSLKPLAPPPQPAKAGGKETP